MVEHTLESLRNYDPTHISCVGRRTVITCKGCAGNAPRHKVCVQCGGVGFNIFPCAHCNPAGALAAIEASKAAKARAAAAAAAAGTAGPAGPAAAGTGTAPPPGAGIAGDPNNPNSAEYANYGDGAGTSSCGMIDNNVNRQRKGP
ncbi:hypothetical protein N7535_007798 [Penicillium sp. DV-2018c]|nr:hypothetical protein N7535_007798 [Penicillium sp. DV-2018c]